MMAFSKRKEISIEIKLWNKIKKSVKQIKGLTNEQNFVETYKHCYPNFWIDICEFHNDMKRWNKQRISRHLSNIYSFTKPEQFLLYKSKHIKKAVQVEETSDAAKNDTIIENIRQNSLQKLAKRNMKKLKRERLKQQIEPSYASQHIKAYFAARKEDALDIDTRYLIVHELAKYKCSETIKFLKKLVQCEKNMPLQHYAWQCLKEFGITGIHIVRRKGKKKISHTKVYNTINTPQDLLMAIYNSPLEHMKKYDLFLSHSYKDNDKLIELKGLLNEHGLNVYMDWVNDKDELSRTLTSAETAEVLTERIKVSKAIFYVHTDSSFDSKWTPWELGYAYAIDKPIIVYRPEQTQDEPEYLQLHSNVILNGRKFFVEEPEPIAIKDWLNKF